MKKPKIVLYEADITYKVKNKEISFSIVHNIAKEIDTAFESWVYRTKEHTAESFCKYIQDRDLNNVAITKDAYENFNIEAN